MTNQIDPNLLRQLLRYEPETGKLFWLARPVCIFKATKNRTAEHTANAWNARCAGKEAMARSSQRCRLGTLFGKTVIAHRVAWAVHFGAWPKAEIDHINGDPRDNRLENLRDVSRTENCRNTKTPSSNTSGVMGVSWHKRKAKWRADIKTNKYHRHLGYFTTKEAAIYARKAAERELGFHPNHGRVV